MDNNKDYLKQAQHCLDVGAAKIALEQMKDIIPVIVEMNKSVYDEMKKQGFSDKQAFDFSCQYTIESIFNTNN